MSWTSRRAVQWGLVLTFSLRRAAATALCNRLSPDIHRWRLSIVHGWLACHPEFRKGKGKWGKYYYSKDASIEYKVIKCRGANFGGRRPHTHNNNNKKKTLVLLASFSSFCFVLNQTRETPFLLNSFSFSQNQTKRKLTFFPLNISLIDFLILSASSKHPLNL